MKLLMQDMYLRAVAETENIRTRSLKEIKDKQVMIAGHSGTGKSTLVNAIVSYFVANA
jgi:putative ribosome biogenesis GTPase RsgA